MCSENGAKALKLNSLTDCQDSITCSKTFCFCIQTNKILPSTDTTNIYFLLWSVGLSCFCLHKIYKLNFPVSKSTLFHLSCLQSTI